MFESSVEVPRGKDAATSTSWWPLQMSIEVPGKKDDGT
jgi:hypothetical protein